MRHATVEMHRFFSDPSLEELYPSPSPPQKNWRKLKVLPDEQFHGLRYKMKNIATQDWNSDDFGAPVIQKTIRPKSATSNAARLQY